MIKRLEALARESYVAEHSEPEPLILKRIAREASINHTHPRMISGHIQGLFLGMLVQLIQPSRILEIGTYVGYATLAMGRVLPKGGKITTLEVNDELEETILTNLRAAKVEDRVDLRIGNAIEIIKELEIGSFDMIYLDADKAQYPSYYHAIVPHLRSGALLIADNTLWGNKVWHDEFHDPQTQGIRTFNTLVAQDDTVEQLVLDLRDGLTLIRKK